MNKKIFIAIVSLLLLGCVNYVSSRTPGQLLNENTGEIYKPFIESYVPGRNDDFYKNRAHAPTRDLNVGVFYSGRNNLSDIEGRLGRKFDSISVYNTIEVLDEPRIVNELYSLNNQGYEIKFNILFNVSSRENTLLADIVAGRYDGQLLKFGQAIRDKGFNRPVLITTMHEFNFDYYPWGVYYGNNTPEKFKRAYRHIVDTLRSTGANLKFVVHYNRNSKRFSGKTRHSFADMYPGDRWVDYVGVSSFNRAFTSPHHSTFKPFKEDFKRAYDEIVKMTDRPIIVAETSSVSYKNYGMEKDTVLKADWITETFRVIDLEFPRVVAINWFLLNKGTDDTGSPPLDWSLNTADEISAFRWGSNLKRR